ncbi:hypothetical protein IT157_04485 [bacterium]|nr:hypothetical protein [bacterium]
MILKNHLRPVWSSVVLPLLILSLLWFVSCSDDDESSPTAPTAQSTCLDCHSNEGSLRATALPDSGSGDSSGEG